MPSVHTHPPHPFTHTLGAGIGSPAFREGWVQKHVDGWVEDVRKLSAFGRVHPHHAYCLLVRFLVPRWRYTMRTTKCSSSLYLPLEDVLKTAFFPGVFGWAPDTSRLRDQCALPTRHGGLGIPIPTRMAEEQWAASQKMTAALQRAMLSPSEPFRVSSKTVAHERAERRLACDKAFEGEADEVSKMLSGRAARGFEEARLRGGSSWLSMVPLDELAMGLDRSQFRDAIALRMGLPFPDPLPSHCPSCGFAPFDVEHALKCKRGGWVSRRHLEVIRAWKRFLIRGGYTAVQEEPLLRPLPPGVFPRPGTTMQLDARGDLSARGEGGRTMVGDVAIIDSGCPTYAAKPSFVALQDYESRKNTKYFDRIAPYGAFIPLVCTVYGTLGPSAALTAHRVAQAVDPDRDERSAVVDLHAAVLQAAVIKATSLCLRARSCNSLPLVDVAQPEEDATCLLNCARERDGASC